MKVGWCYYYYMIIDWPRSKIVIFGVDKTAQILNSLLALSFSKFDSFFAAFALLPLSHLHLRAGIGFIFEVVLSDALISRLDAISLIAISVGLEIVVAFRSVSICKVPPL